MLIKFKDSSNVSTPRETVDSDYLEIEKMILHLPIAIVRCRPHRHNRFVKHEFIAFHDQLMSTGYQRKMIGMIKLTRQAKVD